MNDINKYMGIFVGFGKLIFHSPPHQNFRKIEEVLIIVPIYSRSKCIARC